MSVWYKATKSFFHVDNGKQIVCGNCSRNQKRTTAPVSFTHSGLYKHFRTSVQCHQQYQLEIEEDNQIVLSAPPPHEQVRAREAAANVAPGLDAHAKNKSTIDLNDSLSLHNEESRKRKKEEEDELLDCFGDVFFCSRKSPTQHQTGPVDPVEEDSGENFYFGNPDDEREDADAVRHCLSETDEPYREQ